MRNVIAVDFKVHNNWAFQEAIENSTNMQWEVMQYKSNHLHGNFFRVIFRYLIYFRSAFKLFYQRSELLNLIAWQQFYGLLFVLFCNIFKVKKTTNVIIMTFIYKRKKGIIGVIYHKMMKSIVRSKYLDKIVVYSSSEVEYYAKLFGVDETLFINEMFGISDCFDQINNECIKGQYISAGRSNRDYDFLIGAWRTIDAKLSVICDNASFNSEENITVYRNSHGRDYLRRLGRSYATIIALDDENISSGQLVVLQSFMLGKPVIVTDNKTIRQYVEDGVNGLIINKDRASLQKAIDHLNNEGLYHAMSQNARASFINKYSEAAMADRIGKKIHVYLKQQAVKDGAMPAER